MKIGTFTRTQDGGYSGSIPGLRIPGTVELQPVESKSKDMAPDFTLRVAGCDLGAGWKNVGRESKRPYIAVVYDDPTLPGAIKASLFEGDDGQFNLVWNRREEG